MNFNKHVAPPKWEFGYWGQTINNWYRDGLPPVQYPEIPAEITAPTSTLYTAAWTCQGGKMLPNGFPVMVGGLYWHLRNARPRRVATMESDERVRLTLRKVRFAC